MSLRVIAGGAPRSSTPGPRRLAPGAPPSPGTVPLELAELLRTGEAVVWWDYKDRVNFNPVLWTLAGCVLVLGGVSLFAPELWLQPWRSVLQAVAVTISPAALVYLRERLGLRHMAVTDNSIIQLSPRGKPDRIAFRNIRRVRRDLITGGIQLDGDQRRIRIPPALMADARAAIESQTASSIRASADQPDDPLGWLP